MSGIINKTLSNRRLGIRRATAFLGVVLASLAGLARGAETAAWTAQTKGSAGPGLPFSLGFRFVVDTPILVTQLGRVDYNGGGLAAPAVARLYDWDTGAALASTTLPAGMANRETNGILAVHYAALGDPVALNPGNSYLVAVEAGSADFGYAINATMAPGIRWLEGRATPAGSPALPAAASNTTFPIARTDPAPGWAGYFGASFKFVPVALSSNSLYVLNPRNRSVRQRDLRNYGEVEVACQGGSAIRRVEASASPVPGWTGATLPPQALATTPTNGWFAGRLRLKAGWHQVSLVGFDAGGLPIATGLVQRVGVGEVVVAAGQSNAANHGQPGQDPADDRVSCSGLAGDWRHAVDPQPEASGTGGSPWPAFGDALAGRLGVPVGILSVAVGATRVDQWLPGASDGLYLKLRGALQLLGTNGCRAVLWHQGESDSLNATPAAVYAQRLRTIIERSRLDAGYTVPWGVAIASWHPDSTNTSSQAQVRAGQWQVITNTPGVFKGPETDSFHLNGYLYDAVHFNTAGLTLHGRQWAEALQRQAFPKPRAGVQLRIEGGAPGALRLAWNVETNVTCEVQQAASLEAGSQAWQPLGDWSVAEEEAPLPASGGAAFFRLAFPHTDY